MKKSLAVNLTSIFVTLVLTALATYFLTSRFSAPADQADTKETNIAQSATPAVEIRESTERLEPVDVLLVGLKQRLETQKDDVDGWILLSKSYYHINRLEEAEQAFEQAKAWGYTGSWKPLPRIDSSIQHDFTSQNLKSMINSQKNKIDDNTGQ